MKYGFSISRPFARSSILIHAPECGGIYGISNAREWICMGQTDNLCLRLTSLLESPGQVLSSHEPTGFSFEICDDSQRNSRLARLSGQYRPACSIQEIG